jgi:hypothetical protein
VPYEYVPHAIELIRWAMVDMVEIWPTTWPACRAATARTTSGWTSCLLSFTDMRHTQTILTVVASDSTPGQITCLRLFRTFKVTVLRQEKRLSLQVLDNTTEEVDTCPRPKIQTY